MFFINKIEKIYRSKVYTRFDDTGCLYYFSTDDFAGLLCEKYDFVSEQGNRLSGRFYYYPNYIADRIVVFDHGMGGGHRSYMKEIEKLAKHGFKVFAYDHTGCMESEGDTTNGFCQSLSDLNACISTLKNDNKYTKCTISVIGHSWGAYSCLNIGKFHRDVNHVVALSGFVSTQRMLKQTFGGFLSLLRPHFVKIEKRANEKYYFCSAEDSLMDTNAKLLVIHSADDNTVSCKLHFDFLKNKLSGRKNSDFLLVDKKGHNPNYTQDAVIYMKEFFSQLTLALKKDELKTDECRKAFVSKFDWQKMTEQDDEVWNKIFSILDEY
ncbi:MAG: alpha/beta fold hydrolase [Ruminococcaceae bacterium]|nr:alpha/beta fold hydrolase [Oscillospiraceae bacterium]